MLPIGATARQARETRGAARFRNLNSAVLMQRLTMSGVVIDAGLTATHLSVIQVIAAHTPRDGWHLEGDGDAARLVSGEAYPSQALIAAKVGRSERQVKTLIRQAAEAGFLSKTMTTQQRRDACGGTILIRRNFYRVRLPIVCAPDGADGVRAALEDETQLRLRRPDTRVPDSRGRGNPTHPEGEAHFPSEGKPTSHDPSVPSDPSIAAAAALRSEEKRCDGIPDPDGKPTTVILRRAPGTDGKPNGSGTVEATGEAVAIPVEAWNLACDGRGEALSLTPRTRNDGTAYLWLAKRPHQRREDRSCGVAARHEAEARAAIPDAPTETLSADEVRRAERRPNTGSFEVIVSRLGIVQLNRETHRAIMGGDPAGVEVIPYGGHWRETRRAACPTDDEFPF